MPKKKKKIICGQQTNNQFYHLKQNLCGHDFSSVWSI